MILSDLPELKESPTKYIISVYYSAWNLVEKAYTNASGEHVLVEEFVSECIAALCLLCMRRPSCSSASRPVAAALDFQHFLQMTPSQLYRVDRMKALRVVRDHERYFKS